MIVRTTTIQVAVAQGTIALSRAVDAAAMTLEADGNEVVSVSHAAHNEGVRNERVWTVLIAYRKAQ